MDETSVAAIAGVYWQKKYISEITVPEISEIWDFLTCSLQIDRKACLKQKITYTHTYMTN